jgi:PAS domain S-box-containing protein
MFGHSLRNRLIAAFVGLALIPLLVAGGMLGWHNYTLHVTDSYARQQQMAQRVAVELNAFLRRFELRLEDTDTLSNFAELNREGQHQVLSRLLAKRHSLREIWFLDEAGKDRVYLSKVRITAHEATANPARHKLFEAALHSDRAVFSPIRYDADSGEPLMHIAMPVIDPNSGAAAGILGAEVRVKAIWELVSSLKIGAGEDVYILDAQQRIIAHRNPSVVLRETRFQFAPEPDRQAGLSGEEAFIASHAIHLGGQSFTVVVERTAAVALAPALTGLKIVGAVTVFALAIALVLFYAAVRRIVVPIQEVAAAARSIRDGNLERCVAVGGSDEIVDLATAFNSMTTQLRTTLVKLQGEVHERQQAEKSLAENRHILRTLIDSVTMWISYFDTGGRYIVANQRYADTFGMPLERIEGSHYSSVLPAALAQSHAPYIARCLAGETVTFEEASDVGAAQPLYTTGTYVPVRDSAGIIIGGVVAVADISPLKHAEIALKELNANLEQRVREQTEENLLKERLMLQQSRHAAMGEMISAIAHQWRQPLNALAITLANLKDSFEFGELDQAVLDSSMANSNRLIQKMSTTIDDFRNFFRPRQLMEKFQVGTAIHDAVQLIEASLRYNNIELTLDCEEGIEAYGASNELGQVVLNLVVNAKEASLERKVPAPRIAVSLRRDGENAAIIVEDNAGGIDPQVGERIFDPYFTTKTMGTGIGLYMARIIVERHLNGHIAFANTGAGARFSIAFPLKQANPTDNQLILPG